jgi:hypothetical protein
MDRMLDEIIIGNEKITMPLDDIPIEEIDLDEANPRIRYRHGLNADKAIDEVILGIPEVKALRKDISLNGGLRERIIVQKKKDGRNKVIEGNVRATCYRSLHKTEPDDPRWQKIPARILPEDIDEKKIAILLSDMHVAGKIVWDAHEKAGQVYRMVHDLAMTYDDVAIYMRQGKSTVTRFYNAYAFLVETYLPLYPDKAEGKWSFFDELFRSKPLKEEMKHNPDFGEQFCTWVGEGRLRKGIEVRDLPQILANTQARERFEKGKKETALAEALTTLEKADPEHGSDFFKQLAKMHDNLTSAAQVKEILRIRNDKKAREKVVQTYEALVDFMRLADVAIPPLDDDMKQAAE